MIPLFQGVYAARSEVEAARPHNACARQTIRRLVSLGFTLDVLKKSFGADPKYEIPSSVFLQDMSEVRFIIFILYWSVPLCSLQFPVNF